MDRPPWEEADGVAEAGPAPSTSAPAAANAARPLPPPHVLALLAPRLARDADYLPADW